MLFLIRSNAHGLPKLDFRQHRRALGALGPQCHLAGDLGTGATLAEWGRRGRADWGLHRGRGGVFAATFCIAHTDSSVINTTTGLPGPGALSLPAVATLTPAALPQ